MSVCLYVFKLAVYMAFVCTCVCKHYIIAYNCCATNVSLQQMKSVVAAKAIKHMNPDINVIAHQNRVGPETEGIL